MKLQEGHCYYHRGDGNQSASVRKIIKIEGETIQYQLLWGSFFKKKNRNHDILAHQCGLHRFGKWMTGETEESENYHHLDGMIIHKTYLIQNTKGEVILRCGQKRADFYLRKGYAIKIDENTLRMTTDDAENKLKEVHGDLNNPFFTAIKNKHCYVCGGKAHLTRHHVFPRTELKTLPLEIRSNMSNIVIICDWCHKKYEDSKIQIEEADPLKLVLTWEKHFLDTMQPKYMPDGWRLWNLALR